MKYTGLTKILAVILALISLSLLVSGSYGLRTAARDRDRKLVELDQIQNTTDEYRSVLAARMDPVEYEKLCRELDNRQQAYDTDAAQHRKDLTTFTAARGAMEKAEDTLSRAEAALQTARTQYESGKKALELQEKTINKFYGQVSKYEPMLEAGENLLDVIQRLRNSLHTLEALREPADPPSGGEDELTEEEEQARAEERRDAVVEAYDAAVEACESTVELLDLLQNQEIPLSDLKQALGLSENASSEEVKDALSEFGIQLTDEQMEALQGDSIVLLTAEQAETIKQSVRLATGRSMEDLIQEMKRERDDIAGRDGLSQDEFDSISREFEDTLETITLMSGVLRSSLSDLDETLDDAQKKLLQIKDMISQMKNAKKQFDKARAALQEAGQQLEMGEQALEEGKKQLKEQQEKLDEQEKALEKEKIRLDEEKEALLEMGDKVGEQKELEDRERSLRMNLLADREIKEKTESGTDLITAAEGRIEAFGGSIRHEYGSRFGGCLLMLTATALAILSAQAVFRREGNRKLFLAGTLLCTICCTAVIWAFYASGRGMSYSGLSTGIAALTAMAAALPSSRTDPGKV